MKPILVGHKIELYDVNLVSELSRTHNKKCEQEEWEVQSWRGYLAAGQGNKIR